MLKWRRRKWPRLLWLFLFQSRKGRKGPFSAQGYYNFLIWCNKLWVLLHNRPQKFTAMAVGAALVEWEEPWITLICKLREKNVERDSQHAVETSLFISQMTTLWNKQQNLITIVVHQDYQPQPYVFSRHRSIPIQHSCFPFPIPSSFLLRKRSCSLCFCSHSFLRLLLTF